MVTNENNPVPAEEGKQEASRPPNGGLVSFADLTKHEGKAQRLTRPPGGVFYFLLRIRMRFLPNKSILLVAPAPWAFDHVAKEVSANDGGIAAQMQADPKKQGKAKKPDENLVRPVFPDL